MPPVFPPIAPDELERRLQAVTAAFKRELDAGEVERLAREIPWVGLRGAAVRAAAQTPESAAWTAAADSLRAFCVRLELVSDDAVDDGRDVRAAFHGRLAPLFDALERAPGASLAFRDAFLARASEWRGISYRTCPAFISFVARGLVSERSVRGDHALGYIAAVSVRAFPPTPGLLLAAADAIPAGAVGAAWRDEAIAQLSAHYDDLDSVLSDEELSGLGPETRQAIEAMARAGWADETALAGRLSFALWGNGSWAAGSYPEIAMEIARALHKIAPNRPEWEEWISAIPAVIASANHGLDERWAPAALFFRQIAAERERLALLGPDAVGAAKPGAANLGASEASAESAAPRAPRL
jgi:hypothetical protein